MEFAACFFLGAGYLIAWGDEMWLDLKWRLTARRERES